MTTVLPLRTGDRLPDFALPGLDGMGQIAHDPEVFGQIDRDLPQPLLIV